MHRPFHGEKMIQKYRTKRKDEKYKNHRDA